MHHFRHPRFGRIAADLAVTRMQRADALSVAGGFGRHQFALDGAQFLVAIEDKFQRRDGQGLCFLGDTGNLP